MFTTETTFVGHEIRIWSTFMGTNINFTIYLLPFVLQLGTYWTSFILFIHSKSNINLLGIYNEIHQKKVERGEFINEKCKNVVEYSPKYTEIL